MKYTTFLALAAAALCLPLAASAQTAPALDSDAGLHWLAGMGVTAGGEELNTVHFTNGHSQTTRAGGVVSFIGGALYQPRTWNFAGELTVGYHVDGFGAKNGGDEFRRFPIEALGFFTGIDKWRIGGGYRHTTGVRYKLDIDGEGSSTIKFKDANGAVLEVQYQVGPRAWVTMRAVREEYEASSYNGVTLPPGLKARGNHVGIGVQAEF